MLRQLVLALLLACFTLGANADPMSEWGANGPLVTDTNPSASKPAFAGEAAAIKAVLAGVFDNATKLATDSPLRSDGQRLAQLLLVIAIAWFGLRSLLSEGGFPEAVANIVNLIFLYGLVQLFLAGEISISLVKTFDAAAGKILAATGSPIDMTNPVDGIQQILAQTMVAIRKMFEANVFWRDDGESSWLSTLFTSLRLDMLLDGLGAMVGRLLIALALTASAAVYIGVLLLSQTSIQLALCVAPIFVPWLLWKATRGVFDAWLRFLVTAGVLKVVGAFLLAMTFGFLEHVSKIATTTESAAATWDTYAYFVTFLLSVMGTLLMAQAPSLAAALSSGHLSTSIDPRQAIPRLPSGSRSGGGGGGGSAPPRPGSPGGGGKPSAGKSSSGSSKSPSSGGKTGSSGAKPSGKDIAFINQSRAAAKTDSSSGGASHSDKPKGN